MALLVSPHQAEIDSVRAAVETVLGDRKLHRHSAGDLAQTIRVSGGFDRAADLVEDLVWLASRSCAAPTLAAVAPAD